ncbi:MAG: protein-L-isoaspartate(D-aspartate) O-methyltransferase, partial [Candidatus Thiodiazotropha sp.]
MRLPITFFGFVTLCLLPSLLPAADFEAARQGMIDEIEADVRRTSEYLQRPALNPGVLRVMGETPRHLFVPEELQDRAYENRPLPIGYGQTISQPYIVAIMTDLIDPQPGDRALEIGTGSGYQAAVLSPLVSQVYSMEIVEPLGEEATERLQKLGYDNVEVKIGDGYFGWEAHAPYDIIIVTAAASHIPPPLVKQLKPGGRMIIPVGSRFMTQQLLLVDKDEEE